MVINLRPPLLYEFLSDQDTRLQDQFFRWRDGFSKPLGYKRINPDDIVIVSIDDDSATRLGTYPPWPRQLYAMLLRELRQSDARVVAMDLVFDGPSRLNQVRSEDLLSHLREYAPRGAASEWKWTRTADDKALVDELRKWQNVVLAANVEVSTNLLHGRSEFHFHTPYEPFIIALGGDAGVLGNVVTEPDPDGLVRRSSLLFERFAPLIGFTDSFVLRVVEKNWHARKIVDHTGRIFLADRSYDRKVRINYVGPAGTFQVIPFWKALNWRRYYRTGPESDNPSPFDEEKLPNPFRGKIVLIGYHSYVPAAGESPEASASSSMVPFDSVLTPVSGITRPMSGVELQANVLANVLSSRYLSEPVWWEETLMVLFVALLFGRIFSGLHGRPWSMLAAVLLFALVWLVDAFLAFVYLECVIPVVVPVFGVAVPAYFLVLMDQNLFAFRERRKHTRMFRALAPERVAEEIDRRKLGELGLEGKSATITVLLCQVPDFSSATAGYTPDQSLRLFNSCLSGMIDAVYEHSGIVDRIWNYGILAFWGAPLPMREESQARLAASCCMDIRRRLGEIDAEWRRSGQPDAGVPALDPKFAINTGEAVCGRIGNEKHTEYGALGKTVDVSVRFEALNKRYATACITGEPTAELIRQQFEVRELDMIKLDLHDRPLRIYELMCPKGKLPGAVEEAHVLYRQGLAAMEERNFAEAERLFTSILRLAPDDKPTLIMLDRCREFQSNPPAPNWDGAILLLSD